MQARREKLHNKQVAVALDNVLKREEKRRKRDNILKREGKEIIS